MNFKNIFFLFILTFSIKGFAQGIELSPLAKVSLLTVGTANDLSSKFGHTAIRVKDPAIDKDFVFGYGGFDFEDPLFYYKFTTGKLDYSMTAHRYTTFIDGYRFENRWVKEQSLNLSNDQKKELFQFLQKNYRKENRNYKYDFLFDNCATKVPEVFDQIFDNSLNFDSSYIQKPSTFRQLIHETLDTNSWATFGIDLALGSVIDREATAWEHQFLPLYVQQQFNHITVDGKPLVKKEELVLDTKPISETSNFFLTPLFWMIVLLLMVVFRTYFDHQKGTRSKWLDFALFFATGIAGILIAFLWFATDHSSTKMNFNILWAVAPNIGIAFYLLKKQPPKWISKYLILLVIFIGVLVVFWFFKMQVFSPLMIFILAALGLRYLFLLHDLSPNKFPNIT